MRTNGSVAHLPRELIVKLDKVAKENERSRAAELRLAVKHHIAKHGSK
jgi:hypothetical protein